MDDRATEIWLLAIDWRLWAELSVLGLVLALPWLMRRARQLRIRLRRRLYHRGRQLVHARHLVRMAEELAGLGHWEYDTRTQKQIWSPGLYDMFGLEGDEVLCKGDTDMLLADGGREFARQLVENIGRREPYAFDMGAMRVDGEKRTFRMHVRNRIGKGGEVRRIYGVAMDITEQVRREEALLESEREARNREERARHMAETDPLTGIANRRRVMEWLDHKISAANAGGETVSLVMIDLDHFKAVNDTYGHNAGDEVLKRVAEIARESARKGDLVGRMGGEEFVIGLRDADRPIAFAAAERLRRKIALESAVGNVPAVTASMGYATWRQGDTSLKLFARADEALYAAKDAGRNQVMRAA